jgi:hypothetical protein
MDLRFSLPEIVEGSTTEIRPAEVKRWIAALPALNIAETSQMLFKALSALNRTAMDDHARRVLLDLYRAPIRSVCTESQKLYVGLPLPLPEKTKLLVERVRQFQSELAYGYKRLVVHATQKPKHSSAEKAEIALILQRAIYYLTQVMARSFELYAPSPEGTWHEMHQLYRYAEVEGVTETPVADDLNDTVAHSSVSHVYKQALLLDFSDPYHLPARMLEKIRRYLDRWAPMAQLSMAVAALRPDCQFLINLATNRAGVANIESQPITTEAQYRLLTTLDLVRVMHQQLSALQAGTTPDLDGLEAGFYANQGHEMLTRLITSWGVNPKRHFTRSAKAGSQFGVATGVEAINFFVNGSVEFLCSTNEVGPPARRTQIGGTVEMAQLSGKQFHSATWDVLDESAGGFSLRKSDPHLETVRVGDLIATQPRGHETPWCISVVRWVRSSGPHDVEIGAQRLAPSASAIALQPMDEMNATFRKALRLPEVKALRQAESLIGPRGLYKPARKLILDNGFRSHQIRATKLINVTGSFEQFQFALDV